MMKLIGVLFVGVISVNALAAADIEAGKKKADVFCAGCHGPTGIALHPQNPNLQGQNVVYTVAQLKAFKDGRRKNPVMTQMASMLSEEDMLNIATYYKTIKD
jgi:cytochrome c553